MVIFNNMAAMFALNENNKHANKLSKAIKQASSGMKLNSAGDDASGYAISEKMRVKIRAFDQDDQNVKNGESMLRVAEGAVQSQINLMRTIKEKVIDASNDSNTDIDRMTIQKEINHLYDEIEDTYASTTYNGKNILIGDTVVDRVGKWVVKPDAERVEESAAGWGLIHDATLQTLDGITDDFALFDDWKINADKVDMTGTGGILLDSVNPMTGATDGDHRKVSFDLGAHYSSVNQLLGKGISVNNKHFVLTDAANASTVYQYNNSSRAVNIDISGCSTVAEVAELIAAKAAALPSNHNVSVEAGTAKIISEAQASSYNSSTSIEGWKVNAKPATSIVSVPASGMGGGNLSGGTNTQGIGNADSPIVPGKPASLTKSMSGVSAGTGITIHGGYYSSELKFVAGSAAPSTTSINGYTVYTVGVNYTGALNIHSRLNINMSGGSITFTAKDAGVNGNTYSISDGFSISGAPEYKAVDKVEGTQDVVAAGTSGEGASFKMDLSAYDTKDSDVLENFIKAWKGKALVHSNYDGSSSYYGYWANEFIDTADPSSLDSKNKIDTVIKDNVHDVSLDLNTVRTQVSAGTKTIAEAFADLVCNESNNLHVSELKEDAVDPAKITGLSFKAHYDPGTGESLKVQSGQLRSYTMSFADWQAQSGVSGGGIADALVGKGFRAYCATDRAQWFNFRFVDQDYMKDFLDKPESGGAGLDIKNIDIDVTNITSIPSLLQAIYDEAEPKLKEINHFMHVAIDKEAGTLTLYDERASSVTNIGDYPDLQEKGAKICDGIMDNVIREYRDVYAKQLIIHHTDKANMNICIRLPQTSLDQIFGFNKMKHSIREYNVMTKEMREQLLGVPPDKGILDEGIEYLLDANTMIGSQINHMWTAGANLTVARESTTAAESVIRDADMAKTMADYSRENILSQAAQAMLAQANQVPSTVLELLQ